MNTQTRTFGIASLLAAAVITTFGASHAAAQISDENPPVMLQWFECR